MDNDKDFPKRKDIRLKNYDYSSPGAYFVTICTENRKNYFWNGSIDPQIFSWRSVGANCVRPQNLPLSDIGNIVLDELKRWNQTYPAVSLYSYVIMPNHLHIMVVISADEYYCTSPSNFRNGYKDSHALLWTSGFSFSPYSSKTPTFSYDYYWQLP